MRILRPLLAFVFTWLIVFGIWKWYAQHQEVQFTDPLRPLWGRITYTLQEVADGLRGTPRVATDDLRIPQLDAEFSQGELDKAQLATLLQDLPTKGATDARVVIIEYCHYDSTYCKQAYDDGALLGYQAAYPAQVQYAYEPMLPSSDDATALPHLATMCARALGSTKQYFAFHSMQYENYTTDAQALLDDANVLGIHGMQECMQGFAQRLALQKSIKASKALFDLTSLPTYILLNKQTGKYVKVPGLYEEKQVLDALAYILQ
jgi:hypothetical protein